MPVLEGGLQHRVRVAANLCRIVERELRLGPRAVERERQALQQLLGSGNATLPELNDELSQRLRTTDDDAFLARAAEVLLAVTRDKLAVDKPGYAT